MHYIHRRSKMPTRPSTLRRNPHPGLRMLDVTASLPSIPLCSKLLLSLWNPLTSPIQPLCIRHIIRFPPIL